MLELSGILLLILIALVGLLMLSSFILGAWIVWRAKENKEIIDISHIGEKSAKQINLDRLKKLEKEGFPEI